VRNEVRGGEVVYSWFWKKLECHRHLVPPATKERARPCTMKGNRVGQFFWVMCVHCHSLASIQLDHPPLS
jgi:hypothetical protein